VRAFLCATRRVVGHYPALVATVARASAESNVDMVINEQQAGAIHLVSADENGLDSVLSDVRGNDDGPARAFGTRRNLQGVQSVHDLRILVAFSNQIKRARRRIDYRSGDDSRLFPPHCG